MKTYKFVTIWRVKAPIERVWKEIYNSKDWPTWWKGVESVVEQGPGKKTIHRLRRFYKTICVICG
jgi:uncharacterized protein YndB with AHSA1/START domain